MPPAAASAGASRSCGCRRASSLRAATAALSGDRNVLWVEPNYLYRAERTPSDTLFSQQWALNNAGGSGRTADADIDAPEAWNVTTGSPSVLVGVVDTGLDASHPDLAPNLAVNPGESGGGREANGVDDDGNGFVDDVRGWDFAADDNDPNDTYGHGSHVAGTIGARGDDGRGVAGIAWQVGLLPLRALNDQGVGSLARHRRGHDLRRRPAGRASSTSRWAAPASRTPCCDAICGAPETLFVVAAGNNGKDVESTPFYPCAYAAANVLCVAATDAQRRARQLLQHRRGLRRPRRAGRADPQHRAGRRPRAVQRHVDGDAPRRRRRGAACSPATPSGRRSR